MMKITKRILLTCLCALGLGIPAWDMVAPLRAMETNACPGGYFICDFECKAWITVCANDVCEDKCIWQKWLYMPTMKPPV